MSKQKYTSLSLIFKSTRRYVRQLQKIGQIKGYDRVITLASPEDYMFIKIKKDTSEKIMVDIVTEITSGADGQFVLTTFRATTRGVDFISQEVFGLEFPKHPNP